MRCSMGRRGTEKMVRRSKTVTLLHRSASLNVLISMLILAIFLHACSPLDVNHSCQEGVYESIKAYTVRVWPQQTKKDQYLIQVRYGNVGIGYYRDSHLTSKDSELYRYYNEPGNPVEIHRGKDIYCNPYEWISLPDSINIRLLESDKNSRTID